MADEAGVQRFVPRTAARDQRNLAGFQRAPPHELMLGAEFDDVLMRRHAKPSRLSVQDICRWR